MSNQVKILVVVCTATVGLVGLACSTEQQPVAEDPAPVESMAPVASAEGEEFAVRRVPHAGEAAEAYFSPDGRSLICNAMLEGDSIHQVYTIDVETGAAQRINDQGADACSHYFPAGDRLIWTSTRDHLDLDAGSFSDPNNYPQGSELYTSALDGSDVVRITDNGYYDAEVSVSPDGQWILFARQIDGEVDLWRMHSDGTGEEQITHTEQEQEGGAFYRLSSPSSG